MLKRLFFYPSCACVPMREISDEFTARKVAADWRGIEGTDEEVRHCREIAEKLGLKLRVGKTRISFAAIA